LRRLDIGVASYGASGKLKRTLESIQQHSQTDFRCFIVDNPGPDPATRELAAGFADRDKRFILVPLEVNAGYAGAVNTLLAAADTDYIAYLDNDVSIQSPGWDETLCSYLDRFAEIGMMFPNGGAYMISRGPYAEIMWACGFAWVLRRLCLADTGPFDHELGHQEEADYAMRVRMAGWKCAAAPEVRIGHDATATSDPAAEERIKRGVVNWVNKWCRYFCGKNLNYDSPNVLRHEDWPPNALYLEDFWKQRVPTLNETPEAVTLDGRQYDLIRVPRITGLYRTRII
jgi:GT2 family glycosyltransferase